MDKKQNFKDVTSFDLVHIARSLWRKIWVIAASGVISAVIGFIIAAFVIAPQYSSSIMLYVNNSSISIGTDFSISSSQLTAAQSLVKTYIVILQNRTTLEKVIEKAEVSYDWEELEDMISASAVNDTEVLKVTVTCKDSREAAKIANTIAEVLPQRIAEIVEGSTMEVVDSGAVDNEKVFPSTAGFTAVGLILGIVLSSVVVVLMAIGDDTIRDEEFILQNYDYPILAKIPDLTDSSSVKSYGYYYKKSASDSSATQGTPQQ